MSEADPIAELKKDPKGAIMAPVELPADKSALVYVLLALFLGAFGVHNLWAGIPKGKTELLLGLVVFVCSCGSLLIINQIIAWFDIASAIDSARKAK